MIIHKHKLIMIHIPKTGCTAIEKHFGAKTQHRTALEEQQKHRGIWNSYYKIAIVRNPWSYMVSRYFFAKKKGRKGKRGYKSASTRTFGQYVRWFVDQKKKDRDGYSGKYFRPMCEWICDTRGTILVDFVGKQESLGSAWNTVSGVIGLPRVELPVVNASVHDHYTSYYDDKTRKIVEEFFHPDIKKFGYSF
jgi:hypothetical protein